MNSRVFRVVIVALVPLALVDCGTTARLLVGSRDAAAGRWQVKEPNGEETPRWFVLDPARDGNLVRLQFAGGMTCGSGEGIIEGNRIRFRYLGIDAVITVHSPRAATLVFGDGPPVSARYRKVGPERSVGCE